MVLKYSHQQQHATTPLVNLNDPNQMIMTDSDGILGQWLERERHTQKIVWLKQFMSSL